MSITFVDMLNQEIEELINDKKYTIQEVFDLLGSENLNLNKVENKKDIIVDGFKVHAQSLRYMTFYQKGTTCACCGKKGVYFKLDISRDPKSPSDRRHFNLYAEDGILITRDHILPKSLGGKDEVSNMQTYCVDCNHAKGNVYDGEVEYIVVENINNHKKKYFISEKDAIMYFVNKLNQKDKKCSKFAQIIVTKTLNILEAISTNGIYESNKWSKQVLNRAEVEKQ